MSHIFTWCAFVILFCVSLPCSAQKFSTSINLAAAVPQGEYKDTDPDVGLGLRANFLYRPLLDIPLKFGVELGMMQKGSASQYFSGYVMGFYEEFKVSASNNIFSLLFLTRFKPERFGKITPFLDLTAGWNVFFSSVNVEKLTYYSSYNSGYSDNSKSRWALAYGAVGGVDIPLGKQDDIGLELKLAYMMGNNTKYLTNPYINGNAEVTFQEKSSETDMLIPQIGIRIRIK
ncbi:MAG: hypothetical protein ABIN48_09350 [Ginsengibacter sp.]